MTDKAQTELVRRTETQLGTLGNRNLCTNVSAFENDFVVANDVAPVRQPETASSLLKPLATAFIVFCLCYFHAAGARRSVGSSLAACAGRGRLYLTTQVLDDAARRLSRYLLMQFAVNKRTGP